MAEGETTCHRELAWRLKLDLLCVDLPGRLRRGGNEKIKSCIAHSRLKGSDSPALSQTSLNNCVRLFSYWPREALTWTALYKGH